MKKTKNKNNNSTIKASIKYGLVLIICFLVAASIVISVVAIFNFLGQDYVKDNYFVFLIICIVAAIIVGWGLSIIVSRYFMRTEIYLSKILNQIAKGDYTTKIPEEYSDKYFKKVIQDFNKMVDTLNSTALLQSDFANNFSHEFKTPIVSIKGYAELLRDNDNLSESDKRRYLNIIIAESERLTNLASSTMLISRLDTLKEFDNIVPVKINQQIEECVILLDKMFENKNINVDVDVKPFTINTNADMLKEVWINLITNAIKYNKNNGNIIIKSYEEDKNYIVEFIDDGIGMNEETLAHIFDKYYQGDTSHYKKGSGLGLPIAKKIVELSGGTITVISKENEGSTFKISFPKKK